MVLLPFRGVFGLTRVSDRRLQNAGSTPRAVHLDLGQSVQCAEGFVGEPDFVQGFCSSFGGHMDLPFDVLVKSGQRPQECGFAGTAAAQEMPSPRTARWREASRFSGSCPFRVSSIPVETAVMEQAVCGDRRVQ